MTSSRPDHAASGVETDPFVESALQTLAGILRGTARHSFALGDPDEHELFEHACEAWARHVLAGGPLPPAASPRGARIEADGDTRAWADLGQFYRERRREECRFVESRVDGFRDVIWDFVDGMREISASAAEMQDAMDGALKQLEGLASDGDPETLRTHLPDIVKTISGSVSQQRTLYSERIRSMGVRLDTLRDDLLVAQRRIQVDGLTQVYNRGAFDDALRRHIDLATLSGQPLGLLMIDLDHFKQINDTWGHQAGDVVLKSFADSLSRCFLRRSDFVARYGGEEFAVILFDTTPDQSRMLAERLLERVRAMRVETSETTVSLTCSIGLAALAVGDTRDSLLARADEALYAAKSAGRDQVCVDADGQG